MSSKKQKDQSLLINTRNSLEKKVKIKLEKLYATIKKHDIAYYENHNPIISDAEYDHLKKELFKLENKYEFLKSLKLLDEIVGSPPTNKFKN